VVQLRGEFFKSTSMRHCPAVLARLAELSLQVQRKQVKRFGFLM
jgi:hypothetical protein